MQGFNYYSQPPTLVVMDSNTFIGECYDFFGSSSKLNAIKLLAADGSIQLAISEVTYQEVKRHIKEEVRNVRSTYSGVKNRKLNDTTTRKVKHVTPVFRQMSEYDFLWYEFPEEEKMVEDALQQFDAYLAKAHIMVIDYDGVDIANIMCDYNQGNPPFEKHKKEEFPDAVIVAQIKQRLTENAEQAIAVISDDSGVQKALEPFKTVFVYEKIADFNTEVYSQVNDVTKCLEDFISQPEVQGRLFDLISDLLYELPVDGLDVDRKGAVHGLDYDEVEITDATLLSQDFDIETIDAVVDEMATVTVKSKCNVEVYGSYFDESNSVWDSEDKEYIFTSYGKTTEKHETTFYVEVLVVGYGTEEMSIDSVSTDLELNEDTRIERIFDGEGDEPWEDER